MRLAEGLLSKGDYLISGSGPFVLTKRRTNVHDEVIYGFEMVTPTLEAVVMFAELNYEEPPEGELMKSIRKYMKGGK